MPWLWLVAGPNGSGKTTLISRGFLQAAIPALPATSLNADVITAPLVAAGVARDTANLAAARLIDAVLAETVAQGRDVIVETVLSSDKYLDLVQRASSSGTHVGLIYVTLHSEEDHLDRVRLRVARGGHDVPTERVLARRKRSQDNLWVFARHARSVLIFDNTAIARPVLVASAEAGRWTLHAPGRLPDLDPTLAILPKA